MKKIFWEILSDWRGLALAVRMSTQWVEIIEPRTKVKITIIFIFSKLHHFTVMYSQFDMFYEAAIMKSPGRQLNFCRICLSKYTCTLADWSSKDVWHVFCGFSFFEDLISVKVTDIITSIKQKTDERLNLVCHRLKKVNSKLPNIFKTQLALFLFPTDWRKSCRTNSWNVQECLVCFLPFFYSKAAKWYQLALLMIDYGAWVCESW